MTEKEKAHAGLLYDGNYDQELLDERMRAAALCHEHNHLHPSLMDERVAVLRKLLGKTGERFTILQPFICDYGYNIEVGENFFANYNCVILDPAKVTFGDNVFIAPNCGFYTAGHAMDVEQRNAGLEYAYPITIGNNVWIGGNAVFMPGVSVGDNTVIGAGSVVTKAIPSNVVAFGNPCRVIRELTSADAEKLPASRSAIQPDR